MKQATPYKPDWTVRKNVTLPVDLHARIKYLSRRDDKQVYAIIVEALRLYEALHQDGDHERQP